jgi:hypothetical protein
LPTTPTVTSSASVGNLEDEPPPLARTAGPDHGAQGTRDPPLPADHLADIVFRDMEAEDERILALHLLHPDRVGVVDEVPSEVRQQVSQCSGS